ncbi:expansin EXLX1 family cellulose-binding protein [Nocardioides sp. NPDC051685]|uniref:expansin EXLX1 family cellulose-binding protein n=1 Tax=Nocardioides sp. NPDC051685 TaxID=3364334 RepID=UPI0037B95EDF
MRTTKHSAAQPLRRHPRIIGIPLALLAVGVVVCLSAMLLGGGADTRRTADESVTAAPASDPAGSPTAAPDATITPAQSPIASPLPSPRGTRTPSAASRPRADSAGSTGSLAGRIRPATRYRGVATAYEAGDGNGACLYGPSDDLMVAAMNHTDYETAKACGAYVRVRAANGASVTVRIVNECPLPCAPGQIDLSQQAFARLADLSVGRLPITWKLLSPSKAGAISIRYKTGSSPYWCGIQVIGHRNPVAALDVRTANGWRKLHRTDYNYFLAPDGNGCSRAIRVTDIYGERLTIRGIAIEPDVAQPTGVQFTRH